MPEEPTTERKRTKRQPPRFTAWGDRHDKDIQIQDSKGVISISVDNDDVDQDKVAIAVAILIEILNENAHRFAAH